MRHLSLSPGRWLAMLTPKTEPYAGVTAVSAEAVRRRWAAGNARDVCAPETTFDPAACLAAMDAKLGPATLAAAAYVLTLCVSIVPTFRYYLSTFYAPLCLYADDYATGFR
jgi:hypothetical protein